ncbi:hypothetical protein K7N10_000030 [Staphylococcus pseudintermedius]|nr:hypothetical protein [Staphylococcus pseudintermedius]
MNPIFVFRNQYEKLIAFKKKYDYSEEKNCNIYNHFRHSCNTSDILVGMVSFDGSKNNLFVPESVVVKKNDKKTKNYKIIKKYKVIRELIAIAYLVNLTIRIVSIEQ